MRSVTRPARRALLFVDAVGLGPGAGMMATTADKSGFAGRVFAEALSNAIRRRVI